MTLTEIFDRRVSANDVIDDRHLSGCAQFPTLCTVKAERRLRPFDEASAISVCEGGVPNSPD